MKDFVKKHFPTALIVLQIVAHTFGIAANADKAVTNYQKYEPIVIEKTIKYKKAIDDYIQRPVKK